MLGRLDGRPAATDPDVGLAVISTATDLAHRLPVLHDISSGGLGVALAEISMASEIGLSIDDVGWSELWSEGPHRLLALCEPGSMPNLDVPAALIGTMGGTTLDFGPHGATELATATRVWRQAIPRRMS